MRLAAGALIALAVLAAPKPKPEVRLEPSPRVAVLSAAPAPVRVRFRLQVKDGGDVDYYCPRVEWEWEDQTRSVEEHDCPPFEEAAASEHTKRWVREREFWLPGVYTITVRLYKADRSIHRVQAQFEMKGEVTEIERRMRRPRASPSPR
jgi:hypothetical protein